MHNLAENWSWARDVNDRDETETSASRDRDVDNFSRDETETRRWYVSKPSRDRDVETKTTTLVVGLHYHRTHKKTILEQRSLLDKSCTNFNKMKTPK